MKIILLLSIYFFTSITVLSQNNVLEKDKWSNWTTDTSKSDDGSFNVSQKRIKYNTSNCLITEEIILFHDVCGNLIRKIKIRSDCKRNIGEGTIIHERKYRSKCEK